MSAHTVKVVLRMNLIGTASFVLMCPFSVVCLVDLTPPGLVVNLNKNIYLGLMTS